MINELESYFRTAIRPVDEKDLAGFPVFSPFRINPIIEKKKGGREKNVPSGEVNNALNIAAFPIKEWAYFTVLIDRT